MKIEYSKQAAKAISHMDTRTKQRIKTAVEKLPDGDIKLLKKRVSVYRLRVGDWRVLFSYQRNETVFIEKIGPRGQIYKEG